jgi:hypothetical protein
LDREEPAGGQGAELSLMGSLPQRLYRSDVEDTYLRKFVEEGEIFFRPLTHFRSVEDQVRRDEKEGAYAQNAAGVKLEFDFEGNGEFAHGLNLEHGAFELSVEQPDHIHIYCFSLTPQTSFGPATMEVFDVAGLLNQISATLAFFKLDLKHGPVTYYDPTSPLGGKLPDDVWLQKRTKYNTEEEYRIAFRVKRPEFYRGCFPTKYGSTSAKISKHITLGCGNLEKFAHMLP